MGLGPGAGRAGSLAGSASRTSPTPSTAAHLPTPPYSPAQGILHQDDSNLRVNVVPPKEMTSIQEGTLGKSGRAHQRGEDVQHKGAQLWGGCEGLYDEAHEQHRQGRPAPAAAVRCQRRCLGVPIHAAHSVILHAAWRRHDSRQASCAAPDEQLLQGGGEGLGRERGRRVLCGAAAPRGR